MLEAVEGIIVRETSYSESSKILHILTREHGMISVLAKGAKKIKNKLSGVTTKLTYATFQITYKKDHMSSLIEVDVRNRLKQIRTDMEKMSYVSYLTELASSIAKDNFDTNLFDLLIATILKIEEGFDSMVLTNILELKYLDYLGVRPTVDACAICGKTTDIVTINAHKSGYLCRSCHTTEPIVKLNTIKLIRMFYYVDIGKISKLEMKEDVKNEIDTFVTEYYDEYTGISLKTKIFLKNLKKLVK